MGKGFAPFGFYKKKAPAPAAPTPAPETPSLNSSSITDASQATRASILGSSLSTQLTSPKGDTTDPTTKKKTLLGAYV